VESVSHIHSEGVKHKVCAASSYSSYPPTSCFYPTTATYVHVSAIANEDGGSGAPCSSFGSQNHTPCRVVIVKAKVSLCSP
jgi:hypothetical protein